MQRTGLVCAIVLALWPVAAGAQKSAALPQALQAHLKAERFQIVTSIRGLPLGIRNELQMMWGTGTLDIADPGDPPPSGPANARRPTRRLIAAGCASDHHCLVYYERGTARTPLVALFHWTPDETRFEWGGTAPAGLKTVEAVQAAVLAGKVESDPSVW